MRRHRRWFFDFDLTLYDTFALKVLINERLVALGSGTKAITRTQRELERTGYSFERQLELLGHSPEVIASEVPGLLHLMDNGNRFLLPGVRSVLRRLHETDECNLLTFGNPLFQMRKFDGATDVHPYFKSTHFVWHDRTKGQVIREYSKRRRVSFVDDSTAQLQSVAEMAPDTELFRMMWPQFKHRTHLLDNIRWRVVRSMEELLK